MSVIFMSVNLMSVIFSQPVLKSPPAKPVQNAIIINNEKQQTYVLYLSPSSVANGVVFPPDTEGMSHLQQAQKASNTVNEFHILYFWCFFAGRM